MTPESVVHGSGRLTRDDGRLTILRAISLSLFSTYRLTDSSIREHCQVELAETLRIGNRIDGYDLSVPDREVEDHQQPPPRRYDDANGTVDERRLGGPGAAHHRPASHGRGAADLPRRTRGQGRAVGSQ